MIRTGILAEGAPIELIDGVLILKDRSREGEPVMSVSPAHSLAVGKLEELRPQLKLLGLALRTQQPITLSTSSEPEPDGAIVMGPPEKYIARHPSPSDILCLFEVADSSLANDRTTKLRMYARAGIPHYIILNLVDSVVEWHRLPDEAQGTYSEHEQLAPTSTLNIDLAGRGTIGVSPGELLP
jgi:Uma2 family endonuclease